MLMQGSQSLKVRTQQLNRKNRSHRLSMSQADRNQTQMRVTIKYRRCLCYLMWAKLSKSTSGWTQMDNLYNNFRLSVHVKLILPIIWNPQNYILIVDDTILDMILQETNRNAKRYKPQWKDVSIDELEVFFAILLYMGLVPYPKISEYWSKKFLYRHCFVRHVMAINRFQCILRFIYFIDNETADKQDRLNKIRPLVEALTKKFKDLKVPSELVSIDETMVPFRGRLLFLQYILGKASKYGVKMLKLCDESGYTYETQAYSGKRNTNTAGRHSNNVVLNLLKDYLDQVCTLVADNFYNNMELTNILLQRKTHNVGTLRINVKGIPKDVLDDKKMKKGEIKGKECKGVVVGHWKGKRSVRFITTRHTLVMTEARKKNHKGKLVYKPEAIKMGIEISDQMSSYFSVLRRTIRWYHKVTFEYLFGTAVVNCYYTKQQSTEKFRLPISGSNW